MEILGFRGSQNFGRSRGNAPGMLNAVKFLGKTVNRYFLRY